MAKIGATSGRVPKPAKLIDNKIDKYSKEELHLRLEAEDRMSGISTALTPPEYLKGEAKKEFNRIVGLYRMAKVDVLNDLDLGLLGMCCETWAKWVKLNREEKGLMRKAPNGNISLACADNEFRTMWKTNQSSIEKAQKFTVDCFEKLGLSVTGRARLGIMAAQNKADDDDPMSKMLNDKEV